VTAVLRDPDQLFSAVKRQKGALDAERIDASTTLANVQRDLTTVQRKRGKLLDLYLSDGIEKALFESRDTPLRREEERLVTEVERAQALVNQGTAESTRRASVLRYCELVRSGLDRIDDAGRQRLLRLLVDKVLVSDNGLEVHGILPTETQDGNRPESHPIVVAAAYPALARSRMGAANRASSSSVATTGTGGHPGGRAPPPRNATTGRS